jgi:hypothetical protein
MKTFYYTVELDVVDHEYVGDTKTVYIYSITNNKPHLIDQIKTDYMNCSEDVARNFLKDELSLNDEKFMLVEL